MSLQDSLFSEDVEHDVTVFSRDKRRKRVLVFPPVNNYRRFVIHQLVQDRFADLLHTFSIGQGTARRTVVCYKSDVIRDPKLNGVADCRSSTATRPTDTTRGMGVEGRRSPSASPERARAHRQAKSAPAVEIYRPPAARRARSNLQTPTQPANAHPVTDSSSFTKTNRQKRPDRAVYVPRHRRSLASEGSPQPSESGNTSSESSTISHRSPKINASPCAKELEALGTLESDERVPKDSSSCDSRRSSLNSDKNHLGVECDADQVNPDDTVTSDRVKSPATESLDQEQDVEEENRVDIVRETVSNVTEAEGRVREDQEEYERTEEESQALTETIAPLTDSTIQPNASTETIVENETNNKLIDEDLPKSTEVDMNTEAVKNANNMSPPVLKLEKPADTQSNRDEIANQKNRRKPRPDTGSPDVLIISDDMRKEQRKAKEVTHVPMTPPEKKVKKIERPKSKPAPPPSPPLKINRDECDWDSLFDDNGDCLDPTLIEELTSAVGEVTIEQPKNDYKAYAKQVEVSSDEFAHVVEIYNFPSDFKTSDLAAVFSPFKNGGFELKWVDDTHCLGVFSSPLIAAEVLASDHPFVKTRPLSEATALSKTKARRSAEFLQPYRSRPETCAALARRLVTGALGVRLATARQEREHEKTVLREAKEKRRLANKQRDDAWEGVIPQK